MNYFGKNSLLMHYMYFLQIMDSVAAIQFLHTQLAFDTASERSVALYGFLKERNER